jgi:hypothetical protein
VDSLIVEELIREAEADPDVVGVVPTGSRGKGALVNAWSDHDVWVILRDAAARDRWAARHPLRHGDPVEVVSTTLAAYAERPVPRSPAAYEAYAFAHVTPLIDKLGGEIAALTEAKGRIDPAAAAEPLDDYINYYYRSLKSARGELDVEARFDAAESVGPFLEFLFGAFGRVRPFNKWLRWELEHYPLEPPWTAGDLLPRLERILDGDLEEEPRLFRDAERLARERGLGHVVDGWEPDVPWLRGDPSNEGHPDKKSLQGDPPFEV